MKALAKIILIFFLNIFTVIQSEGLPPNTLNEPNSNNLQSKDNKFLFFNQLEERRLQQSTLKQDCKEIEHCGNCPDKITCIFCADGYELKENNTKCKKDKGNLSTLTLALIAVGVLIGILLIIFLIFCFITLKRRNDEEKQQQFNSKSNENSPNATNKSNQSKQIIIPDNKGNYNIVYKATDDYKIGNPITTPEGLKKGIAEEYQKSDSNLIEENKRIHQEDELLKQKKVETEIGKEDISDINKNSDKNKENKNTNNSKIAKVNLKPKPITINPCRCSLCLTIQESTDELLISPCPCQLPVCHTCMDMINKIKICCPFCNQPLAK